MFGTNVLHSKRGTLSLSFKGVTMPISTLKPGVYASAEVGTWRITGGKGAYQGWTGGGRFASAGFGDVNNVEWDGFVTH